MPPILPVPAVTPFAPVTAVIVMHIVATTIIVEQEEAVAWIPVILVPPPAITDIRKAVATVAIIIAVECAVWVAFIKATAITIAGIAKPEIVRAAG